ncbi:LuxR C-terminal-related transcriptional regulator [Patulibacter sp. NPDC049589]|uniref:LuxR C-terminal-related transcriptional regulator n=1 Tax=Patulibacter sp. NPDC049589 TaxID=3154731 RepID=UPI003438BF55
MTTDTTDGDLVPRIRERARRLLGPDAPGGEELGAIVAACLERIEGGVPDSERLVALAVEAQDALHATHLRIYARRVHLQGQVQAALGRLRDATTTDRLLDEACAAAARSCGLRRVLLSRIDGDAWIPWKVHLDGTMSSPMQVLVADGGTRIPLADCPAEQAVLDDRRPLVAQPARTAWLAELDIVRPYVVVPIAPAGRVVGFLHADHHPEETEVDGIDRAVLWTFAEGFGRAFERLEILHRLHGQREHAQAALSVIDAIAASVDRHDLEFAGDPVLPAALAGDAPRDPLLSPPERPEFERRLTPRERDVFLLMVRGLGTATIADRLVIRPGTVKDHIKSILRKIGASNRAEAIGMTYGYDFDRP